MRILIAACALATAVGLVAPASAQESTAGAESREIVVQGVRNRNRQITNFVDALTQARIRGQLSRFESDVCPAAVGFTPQQNKTVADRIRRVAQAAGVPLADAKCRPNVLVIVADEKEAMLQQLQKNYADPLGNRVKVRHEPGHAIAWQLEGMLDADGIPLPVKVDEGDGRSGYYVANVPNAFGSSRIRPAARKTFLASVLLVEPEGVAGLTTTQLADYAVMRLLAHTDPARLEKSTVPSILRILDAPMGSEVPLTMTAWDLGFLKALYASTENRYAAQQRAEMQRFLKRGLQEAEKSGGK